MPAAVAYSYVRFSSAAQAEGDSLRRQTEGAADYCKRKGLTLDTELSLRDLGVSAFRGNNAAVGNFRTFLDAVKGGRVRPGSVLVVESFDRISRQGIDEGYDLIKSILKAGVRIATLSPEREFDVNATKGLSKGALEIQLILERAAEESETKSKRVGKARERDRERARRGEVITKRTPVWVRYAGGKLESDAKKVKVVRRLARLALDGVGLTGIAAKMNAEGVPVMGYKKFKGKEVVWSAAMVHKVLTSRALLGEYQPHAGSGKNRKPAGAVVPDYYPRVMEPEEFAAVQAALHSRHRVGRGRPAKTISLFSGLLRNARGGGTFTARFVEGREPTLVAATGIHGRGGEWASFPLKPFESAILEKLIEVKVEEVREDAVGVLRSPALRNRLDEIDTLVKRWRAKMDRPELVDVVADKLTELEAERRATATRLAETEAEEGDSLADALGEVRTVGKALSADDSADNRLRCRAAIRRAVESVWCLFLPGRGHRLAAVQVWFRGGGHRDYLIAHKRAGNNRRITWPTKTEVRSFAVDAVPRDLDLRDDTTAARLEKDLLRQLAAD